MKRHEVEKNHLPFPRNGVFNEPRLITKLFSPYYRLFPAVVHLWRCLCGLRLHTSKHRLCRLEMISWRRNDAAPPHSPIQTSSSMVGAHREEDSSSTQQRQIKMDGQWVDLE